MASMPIEMTRWLSKTGRQVTPLLVDFQIPPPAPAAKNVFEGDGMPVTSEMRPCVFAGPIFRQRKPAIVAESSSNAGLVCAGALDAAIRINATEPVQAKGKRRIGSFGEECKEEAKLPSCGTVVNGEPGTKKRSRVS